MTRPGVNVTSRASAPARGAPTDTGTFLVAGFAERGPTGFAVEVLSQADFVAVYGDRVSYGVLFDEIETFFKEGGARALVARIAGPAPVLGTLTLKDGSAGAGLNTLRVDAIGPGAYSSRLTTQVRAGGAANTFVLDVRLDGLLVETSGDLATPTAAVAWGATSDYVRLTDLAAATAAPNNNPRVLAATALSAGTDDHAAATDTQRIAALALFPKALGIGQVAIPSATTDAVHTALVDHAIATNRTALLDAPDTADVPTLLASVVTAATGRTAPERGAMVGPPVIIPGITPGTTRTIPASGFVAGLIARADGIWGTNVPAAGPEGEARFAIGVAREFTDADRETLNTGGLDVIRSLYGGVRLYGYRTISTDPKWRSLADQRLRMEIVNQAEILAEGYEFARIDGRGRKIAEFGGALTGMLTGYYARGDLFGATADEAFSVDTGPAVNTIQSIAAGELHAVLGLHMSPFAEAVYVEIVKIPVTEAL